MAPTPDMIGSIQGNSELSALFEDAQVMAAVGEVARDSSAIAKHQRNPKVMRFYSLMGSLMGDRLTQLGDQQQAQPQLRRSRSRSRRHQRRSSRSLQAVAAAAATCACRAAFCWATGTRKRATRRCCARLPSGGSRRQAAV